MFACCVCDRVVSVRVWHCLSLFDLIIAALIMGPRGRGGGVDIEGYSFGHRPGVGHLAKHLWLLSLHEQPAKSDALSDHATAICNHKDVCR